MNDEPGNVLDNPLFPQWDEDFLNQVFAAQQKAADFSNTCFAKLEEEIQRAGQITDKTAQARIIVHAMQRYRQCMLRPHPQRLSETDSP